MNNLRRTMLNAGVSGPPPGSVDKSSTTIGMVCISNGTDIWFMPLSSWQAYSDSEYQAIGVTVTAAGDCGDNYVRVCSIPYMNCSTPDVGSMSYQGIYWNGYNTYIEGITETTNMSTAANDYNGKRNTTAILAKATSQSNWRTASTITNSSSNSTNTYFPAACCCWRFHTLGTQQGDWYLPSFGELNKGCQNKSAIETSLKALGMNNAYSDYYWSSTAYNWKQCWEVAWHFPDAYYISRNSAVRVRAYAAF